MEHIQISGPWITQKEIDYVIDAATNAWYDNANIYNQKFETEFAKYLGRKFAITLPSCTSGIHLSLLALGIGHGDEVIVPDITWIATAAPISYVHASPTFADIDEKTWCVSANSIEDSITDKTKAIIPVDLYGNIPNMDKIIEIAQEHKISIIEDAAEAIGSEYRCKIETDTTKKAGSFGDMSVFSFHGSKTLTTGEGGMLVTDDKEIYEKCTFLRDHGRDPKDKRMFWNTEVAYKYKMSNMQAALGLAQLERIDELVSRKRRIFSWYKDELKELTDSKNIILNYEGPNVKNTYWMVTIILNPELGIKKEKIIELMKDKNIDCRPFFYPLSQLPAYENLKQPRDIQKRNKISYSISPYGVNLPSGFNMTKEKVIHVCNMLKSLLQNRPILL